ncbi:fibronectin type III domain-containing protein [Thauera humireducens]|uniref:fibronectin type III domain-containing protein n=1 Tax=Thauera humireducens TaxID=1134435 RepID=UPI00311EE9C1
MSIMFLSSPAIAGSTSAGGTYASSLPGTEWLAAGNWCVISIITDNIGATAGTTNDHVSFSAHGLSWTKLYEYTASQGVAGDGVTISAWIAQNTGSTIGTFSFSAGFSASVANVLVKPVVLSSGNPVNLEGVVGRAAYGTGALGELSFSGMPSATRFFLRLIGVENPSLDDITVTSGWTRIDSATRIGSSSNGVAWRAEYLSSSGTGASSSPTFPVSKDTVSILLALTDEEMPSEVPQGTTTITDVAPGATSALVTYSYSAGDATGFECRLNGGTAASIGASPATVSGLTASTTYSIEIRAINAAGAGSWSAVANFTTDAEGPGNLPPSFDGPSIAAISATEGVALSALDVSSRFSDAESALTFSAVGSWPAGVTVSSAGVISGTPTTAGTYSGLQVRATDAGALTADSNAFSITVAAAALPSTITVTEPLKNNTGTLLANVSGVRVAVLEAATLAGVFETSGLTTSASGLLAAITDAAITTGQQYHVVIKLADGSVGITGPITAS